LSEEQTPQLLFYREVARARRAFRAGVCAREADCLHLRLVAKFEAYNTKSLTGDVNVLAHPKWSQLHTEETEAEP
jgi:hypothetical protein